jgi:phage/plasmid-like protein (TIGR03299 family)
MSRETSDWLNQNVLIGYADERGTAWHYRASAQGTEPNHYPGPIPLRDVKRRLFHWQPVSIPMGGDLTKLLRDKDTADGEGTEVKRIWKTYKGEQLIVRSDDFDLLGKFKSGFQIHHYDEWLLEKVANLLDADLHIGSAGLLKNGAMAWVSIELAKTISTPSGVAFRPYLLAATSVDGSISSTYKLVCQLVVCDNTMDIALGEGGAVAKFKHSKYSTFDPQQVRDTLGIVHEAADDFSKAIEQLTNTTVTDRAWARFLDEYTPLPAKAGNSCTIAQNTRTELTRLWNHDDRVSPWKGTAFGVFQATNTYLHHYATVRNVGRAERNMDNAIGKKLSTVEGETQKALDKALARL